MKKSKIIRTFLIATLFCGVSALCACAEKNASITSGDGEQIVIGGNSVSNEGQDEIRIIGAKDLHISAQESDLETYTALVRAVQGEYDFNVTVDATKVVFGTQGKYPLTYSYGQESVTVEVTIYAEPTITNTLETQSVVYTEFYQKIYEGIQAQDGFGNPLEVQLYETGGAANQDGSLNEGEYTITFAAMDRSGQIVYVDKKVTIAMGAAPSVASAYVYDVADDAFILTLQKSDYDNLIAVSFAGNTVPNRFINKEKDCVYIDGEYLFNSLSFYQAYPMRVITATGHSDCTFTMQDEGEVAIDDSAIVAFAKKTHVCFSEISVPQIVLTNHKQTVTPTYTVRKDGESVSIIDNRFTAQKEGKYILSVSLRAGQVLEYELRTYYDLGFSDGRAYSVETGIANVLKPEYTWIKCVITCLATNEQVAVFNEGDDFDSFNEKIKALNKKFVYQLYAVVSGENGAILTQTTQFTVNGRGTQSALADNATAQTEKFAVANADVTSLRYCYEEIGGRTGVYEWECIDETASGKNTALCFGEAFRNELKPGRYITFDIYTQKAVDLYAYLPQFNKYLWYDMEKYVDNEDAHYSGIRFYNQRGELLIQGGFSSGAFVNQWITVEMKLPEKDANGNVLEQAFDVGNYQCGIGIWTANKGVYTGGDATKATYIANVKVSDEQFMTDTTENETVDTSNNVLKDVIIKDLWA